ncbi:MAG: SpoIIE family protein phosphatase [Planctomycetes bacterium]|nr:SpoIIE family protein phosphatase [Planctomycetota bacterium]
MPHQIAGAPVRRVPRFWDTLAFRVGVLVNLAVLLVLGMAALIGYRQERAGLLAAETERLKEEAKVIAVAYARMPDAEVFRSFLDEFCHQMSVAVSPGHHIIALDEHGQILFRAHARANTTLETEMVQTVRDGIQQFTSGAEGFIVATAPSSRRLTIAVAQSTDPIRKMIRQEAVGRATSVVVLSLLIFVVTILGLLVWVRQPLSNLLYVVGKIGARDFDVRAKSMGTTDLRLLADGVNNMAGSLERVERARLAEMLRAKEIQESLLPTLTEEVNGFRCAVQFLPADNVGGDLFDLVRQKDGSVLVAVLDVSGHGVPAALYTALLRTVFRYEAERAQDPATILAEMNARLHAVTRLEDFATCFVLRIAPGGDLVSYARAGHDPAVLVHEDGTLQDLESGGLPLGVLPSASYVTSQETIVFHDRLFLYTDGLHEVFDNEGRLFGRERLRDLLRGTTSFSPQDQVRHIVEQVRQFGQATDLADDATLICLAKQRE